MASRAENVVAPAGVAIGRRESQRARTHLAALLEGTTRTYRVLLRNLSRTGAMLEGSEVPPPGRTVALKRNGLDVLGSVIWKEEGRCGLHFFDPVEEHDVISISRCPPEGMKAEPQRFYSRPGIEGDQLSAEEWAWAKAYAARNMR